MYEPTVQAIQKLMQRILLYPGELYRIASHHRRVRVVQGAAYLSYSGKDYIVQPGEAVSVKGACDMALVSPMRSEALVMELQA
jgi:hypothetical protein